MSCTSRTFYRGSTFKATDERHAVGATIAQPDATANAAACLSEGGLEQLYHASSLAIIHFQVTNPNPNPNPNPNRSAAPRPGGVSSWCPWAVGCSSSSCYPSARLV